MIQAFNICFQNAIKARIPLPPFSRMKNYEDFSAEYRETLSEIADNFRQNLIRHITSDVERISRRDFKPRHFEPVGFNNNGNLILLKNLRLITSPRFVLDDFQVDFRNLCLPVKFSLNDLHLESDYEINETNAVQASDVIKFILSEIRLDGAVGIFVEGDSFMPKNYNVRYDFGKIGLDLISREKFEAFGSIDADLETFLFSLFKTELITYLNDALHRLIGGNVVEYSVTELLIDEPEHIKGYESNRNKSGSVKIDGWLKEFTSAYERHANDPLAFDLKTPMGTCKVSSGCGRLHDFDTLQRKSKVSVYEDDERTVYYANVNLENFTYVYEDFKAGLNDHVFKGSLKISPRHNKMLFKVDCPKDGSDKKITADLRELIDLDISEDLEEHDSHIFANLDDYLMPYLTGQVRRCTDSILRKIEQKIN